jgi:hypothetical protein
VVAALLWLASAAWAGGTDPDDVALPLDIAGVSEGADAGAVWLTVETYDAFGDRAADFTWTIDLDADARTDLFVSAEWDAGLVAEVDNAAEEKIADASVARPSPTALRVSFARSLLGGASSFNYNVVAVTDRNANGEADAGETDTAPDAGVYVLKM